MGDCRLRLGQGAREPGFYTLSQCELCLVFKRGAIPQPRGARNVPPARERTARPALREPEEVRNRIERMFPHQRKIELFARRQSGEWESWGLAEMAPEPGRGD